MPRALIVKQTAKLQCIVTDLQELSAWGSPTARDGEGYHPLLSHMSHLKHCTVLDRCRLLRAEYGG